MSRSGYDCEEKRPVYRCRILVQEHVVEEDIEMDNQYDPVLTIVHRNLSVALIRIER